MYAGTSSTRIHTWFFAFDGLFSIRNKRRLHNLWCHGRRRSSIVSISDRIKEKLVQF